MYTRCIQRQVTVFSMVFTRMTMTGRVRKASHRAATADFFRLTRRFDTAMG